MNKAGAHFDVAVSTEVWNNVVIQYLIALASSNETTHWEIGIFKVTRRHFDCKLADRA